MALASKECKMQTNNNQGSSPYDSIGGMYSTNNKQTLVTNTMLRYFKHRGTNVRFYLFFLTLKLLKNPIFGMKTSRLHNGHRYDT